MFEWLKKLFKGEGPVIKIPKAAEFGRACTWDEFRGNETTVERLQKVIKAAEIQENMLPNILIYGPAGCGKTTLSKIVASQWNAYLIEITGSTLKTQLDLVKLVAKIEDLNEQGRKVIVFIDEVHGIVKGRGLSEDIWLPLLEDGVLHHSQEGKTFKEGRSKFTVVGNSIEVTGVTWIGATTGPGLLNNAIRRRFPVSITLEDYSEDSIKEIVKMYCSREGIDISADAVTMIARRARHRPAIAIHHLLRQARDEAIIEAESAEHVYIKEHHVEEASRLAGIFEGGLRTEDIKVLEALYDVYPDGLGIKTLADTTDLAGNIVQNMVLPFLQSEGYVVTTHKRFLTKEGKKFLEYNYFSDRGLKVIEGGG